MSEVDRENPQPAGMSSGDEGEVLQWTTHPLRRRPLAAVLVTVFILMVGFLVYASTESKAFGTLALVVLFASLAKFYLPTRYLLSDKCIKVKTTTQTIRKNWSQFRSYYPDRNGVLMSPFLQPSRLENFRGIYLIFDNNRDEVIAFIKKRIGQSGKEDVPVKESDK
ncbi:MAG: hypothetical protein AB1483_00110 [Candidatus Zixiibacteriota bacterium]